MKIVHIITGLSTGGAEMMLYKLLSRTNREKFSCEVISLTDTGAIADKITQLGIPVHVLGMTRGKIEIMAFLKIMRLLRTINPDLIQTWLYHSDLIGGLAAKLSGCPNIYWNIRQSNINPEGNKKSTIRVARTCAKLSNWIPKKIICCSHAAKESHRSLGYNDKKMQVIPNGFDLEKFRPDPKARESVFKELGIDKTAHLIGLVARYDPQKDHKNFIHSAKFIHEKYPAAHFLLCGDGINEENSELVNWIEETGISKNFHLMGIRNDTSRLFAAMDITISSSIGEGFSNVIGEALSCEVPCVVTDVGDSALIVGDTGIVVPAKNSQAIADAVGELLGKPEEERKELGRQARERVKSFYSIDHIVSEYESAYLG
jgi:glycosyltransferase involved in cell wall biosynthesis